MSFKVTFTKIRKHLETYKFKCSQAFLSLTKCWSVCEACRLGSNLQAKNFLPVLSAFLANIQKKKTQLCQKVGVAVRGSGKGLQLDIWGTVHRSLCEKQGANENCRGAHFSLPLFMTSTTTQ